LPISTIEVFENNVSKSLEETEAKIEDVRLVK